MSGYLPFMARTGSSPGAAAYGEVRPPSDIPGNLRKVADVDWNSELVKKPVRSRD